MFIIKANESRNKEDTGRKTTAKQSQPLLLQQQHKQRPSSLAHLNLAKGSWHFVVEIKEINPL